MFCNSSTKPYTLQSEMHAIETLWEQMDARLKLYKPANLKELSLGYIESESFRQFSRIYA